MNPTSLYVTTSKIVLRADANNPASWQDLYRLAPYLRNSLCCVVCGNILVEPYTPSHGKCQHHLCAKCRGGKKRIKPMCTFCRDCVEYVENKTLRILIQCYKKMCVMLINSSIFQRLLDQATQSNMTGVERGAGNLIILIREGAAFHDDFKVSGGLPKSVYSILPCIYTNSSTQTLQLTHAENNNRGNVILNANGLQDISSLYSVLYTGSGNKITIKREPKDLMFDKTNATIFKKPASRSMLKSRRGCRCGNATATPGKLTCCGQRCPCYVESKACIECKCRGCRNPHLPDGNKKRHHSNVFSNVSTIRSDLQSKQVVWRNSVIDDDSNTARESPIDSQHMMMAKIKGERF